MGPETEKTLAPSSRLPSLSSNRDDHIQSSAAFTSTSVGSLGSDDIVPMKYPPAFVRWMIVVALLLGEFLIALDLTIVATAIPRITDDYKTIRDVGWYGSGYFLTFAAFQSAWGKVFKYFNMKYAFSTSVIIFSLGSLICALAPTSMALIIGRALTGVGAAGVTNGVYTIIACIVPPAQVAMYLALVGMDFSIASVAGPLLGGVFTEKLSWRWCFWINLPIGGASLAVVLFFFKVPSTMTPTKASLKEKVLQMDFQGTVLVLSSLVCYMLALEEGGVRRPWNSPVVIGLLVGFVALAVLFGFDQWLQGDRAQIVGRIMKRRTIAGLCAFIVLSAQNFPSRIVILTDLMQLQWNRFSNDVLSANIFPIYRRCITFLQWFPKPPTHSGHVHCATCQFSDHNMDRLLHSVAHCRWRVAHYWFRSRLHARHWHIRQQIHWISDPRWCRKRYM